MTEEKEKMFASILAERILTSKLSPDDTTAACITSISYAISVLMSLSPAKSVIVPDTESFIDAIFSALETTRAAVNAQVSDKLQ